MRQFIWFVPHPRRLAIMLAPLVVAVVAVAAALAYQAQKAPPVRPVDLSALNDIQPVPGILVFVSGAVTHPGLYRLKRGDRLYDALAAAGGLTGDADPFRLPDLAGRLKDGEQVKVPIFGVSSGGSVRAAKVDLNAATAEELASLPGFTPALAAAAVAYRDGYGGFTSTRELMTVLGMSDFDYQAAKPYIKV